MVFQGTLKWKEYPLNHPATASLLGPAVVLVSGSIYVHGGFGTRNRAFYHVCLKTRQWTKLTGLKYRYDHSDVLVDDKIFVFGGLSSFGNALPVEAYDVATNTVKEFERCKARRQLAAYLESRRQVIILGTVQGRQQAEVFGFNVDNGDISPYRIMGGVGPRNTHKCTLVVGSQRTLYLSQAHPGGNQIFVLALGPRREAAWSTLRLKGASFLNYARHDLQIVHGLLILFGRTVDRTVFDDIVLVDPQKLEAVQAGPNLRSLRDENLRYEGIWPKPPVEAGSAASNGKLWIVGGRSSPKIIELQLKRTT